MKPLDAVTHLPFAPSLLRECPHPAVQQKYGKGCFVSVYVCKRCQFGERHSLCDAWACNYSAEKTK